MSTLWKEQKCSGMGYPVGYLWSILNSDAEVLKIGVTQEGFWVLSLSGNAFVLAVGL